MMTSPQHRDDEFDRRRHRGDPEAAELNEQVKKALSETRSLVREIGATVIALEEFRQTKRARLGVENKEGS